MNSFGKFARFLTAAVMLAAFALPASAAKSISLGVTPVPAPLSSLTTAVRAIHQHRQLECQLVRGQLDHTQPVFQGYRRLDREHPVHLFHSGGESGQVHFPIPIANEDFGPDHAERGGHHQRMHCAVD